MNLNSLLGSSDFIVTNAPPFALSANALSDTSAVLSWQSSNTPPETQWDMELIREGNLFSGIPTHNGFSTNPITIDTLAPGTAYKYKLRAISGLGAGAWTIETGTFFTHIENGNSCGTNLTIPDTSCNSPISFPIEVRGVVGNSVGVDVILQEIRLIIEHDWLIDLELSLKSPNGVIVPLLDEAGGTNDNFGDPAAPNCQSYMTLLNANACNEQTIVGANPPFTGRYLPTGNLNLFNDGSNPNGVWELVICDDAATNIGRLKFVELVFDPVNCTPPTGLQIVEVHADSVELDWTPGGFCNDTRIEIGVPGFTLGTGTVINAICPPFTLTNLLPDTDYELYFYENCGVNDSPYSCNSLIFKTQCSPPPISFQEDFDGLSTCSGIFCKVKCDITGSAWHNARHDEIDWTVYNGSTITNGTGPSNDISGNGNYIYMESNSSIFFGSCPSGSESMLYSNCIQVDTKNTDTCHLSFNYHMFGNDINSLQLQITTDGFNWVNLWSKNGNQGDEWFPVMLSLSGYDGQAVQFRFVGTKGFGFRGDIGLDEIIFYGSVDNGFPSNTFFADADNDGFGDEDVFFNSCFNFIPSGFVNNSQDCNDANPSVALNTPEIPCNFIDENCSQDGDDLYLPSPVVMGDRDICNGEQLKLFTTPQFGGYISWYDSNFVFIQIGDTLTLNGLSSNGVTPTNLKFFVDETALPCFTLNPTEVKVTVNPNPQISTIDNPTICDGEIFDLNTIQISDANNTNGNLTFHTAFPASAANQVGISINPSLSTTYAVKKETPFGCVDTTSFPINVLASPTATILGGQDTITLCKGTSTFLNGNATGGAPNYNYQWSNGQNTTFVFVGSNANSGTQNWVTFTATDQNQCSNTDSILVKTVSSVDTFSVVRTPASVCNGDDGAIQFTPTDGVPMFHYDWSGPVSGSVSSGGAFNINGLSQGSYSLTVTDDSPEGCELVLNNLVIDGPSAKVQLDSIRDVSCHDEDDGAIFLQVTGNNPTITWGAPIASSNQTVSGLSPGTYSVTVSDGACQSVLNNLEVENPDSLLAFVFERDVSCFGGSDGALDVKVSGGGVQPYTFAWNNAPSVQNPTGLSAGFYQLTITDANSCQWTSNIIEIEQPNAIRMQVDSLKNLTCFGDNSGAFHVSGSGGVPPYQFDWSDGGSGANRINLSAGNYTLTITDANGCIATFSNQILTQPGQITIGLNGVINPICNGQTNGAINVTPSGGNAIYTYNWSNNDTTRNLSNIGVGFYSMTVTDSNGCLGKIDSIEVTAPSILTVDINPIDPLCLGRSDGKIDIDVVAGGTAPFTYLWSDSTTNEDLLNSPSGQYGVTITDANNCQSFFDRILLDGPQVLDISNLSSFSPRCHGESNGTILSNVINGTQPIDYQWNTNDSTVNLNNLPSGDYWLTITDSQGCTNTSDTIRLIDPDTLKVDLLTLDPINCFGDSTGNISVQASGGEAPYNFSWNAGAYSGSSIANLPSGNYQVQVTDNRGCIRQEPPFNLSNPPELVVIPDVITQSSCQPGQRKDSVILQVNGGVPIFNYMWSDSSTNSILTNVVPGEYGVTITDQNGCKKEIEEIKISANPSDFKFNQYGKLDIACHGQQDGMVEIGFEGGTAPYRYLWSPGVGQGIGGTTDSTLLSFSNLQAGAYSLTVTDDNDCVIYSSTVDIVEPEQIKIDVTNVDPISCFNGSDGDIDVNVTGGNFPLTYSWKNAITGGIYSPVANPVGFPNGSFRLVVKDAKNCIDSSSIIQITQPDSFYVQLIKQENNFCFGDTSGVLEIAISGGTADYFTIWNTNDNSTSIQNLTTGTYSVTINDANNCVLTESYNITAPADSISLEVQNFQDPVCASDSNGIIDFDVSGGVPPFDYFLNDRVVTSDSIFDLPFGKYVIFVRDSMGCFKMDSVELFDPPPFDVSLTSQPAQPPTYDDGVAMATINGGVPPFDFWWSNGDSTNLTISDLYAGWYIFSVRDANGCFVEESVSVSISSSSNDVFLDGKIQIGPNPTDGFLQIDFDLDTFQDFQIKLYSADGQLLTHRNLINIKKNMESLIIDSYPSGIYFLTLRNDTGWKTFRINKI